MSIVTTKCCQIVALNLSMVLHCNCFNLFIFKRQPTPPQGIVANASLSEEQRQLAQLSLNSYSFPVESMVVRPSDGTVLSHINANDLLAMGDASNFIESIM